jgi:uncharacterized protein YbaA (DUF1428 family)
LNRERAKIISLVAIDGSVMTGYVDGFVLAVPKKKIREYKRLAQKVGKIWRKHGALAYVETVGNDLGSKWAGIKFPKTVRAKPSETVVFSYILYKDRKHRDMVNSKVMKDPFMRKQGTKDEPMPFDMKRMVYGGFKVLVEA